MKKIVVCLCLLIFLTGCTANKTIGLSIVNENNNAFKDIHDEALKLNYDLETMSADGNADMQMSDISEMIDHNIKVIIVEPVKDLNLQLLEEKAQAKKIKLILINKEYNNISAVVPDYTEAGEMLGRMARTADGDILKIISPDNVNNDILKGFTKTVPDKKNIDFILSDISSDNVKHLTEEITNNPNVSVVLTTSLETWYLWQEVLLNVERSDIMTLSASINEDIFASVLEGKTSSALTTDGEDLGSKIMKMADGYIKRHQMKTKEYYSLRLIKKEE